MCAGFFNSYLGGVDLFDVISKLLVVENNQIIYVSVTQIE